MKPKFVKWLLAPVLICLVWGGAAIWDAYYGHWGDFILSVCLIVLAWPVYYIFWKYLLYYCPGCKRTLALMGKEYYCSRCGTKVREPKMVDMIDATVDKFKKQKISRVRRPLGERKRKVNR